MTPLQQLTPTGTWKADRLHSSIGVEVQHMGVSTFRAGFTDFEASLASSPDGLALRGSARVESFDVQDDALRPHVMSPEFLDVERFPKLIFESTTIREDGDDLVVEGMLTIRGITLPVEARGGISGPLEDPFGNERLAVALEAVVDRTQFGLGWQMGLPDGGQALANEVKLVASLEFTNES